MKNALKLLRKKGYRITPARIALLNSLIQSDTPRTIQELVTCTPSNEVSVYRNIELFTNQRIIEVINLVDSLPRYALSHGHHHHIVCTCCDFIAHIPCNDTSLSIPNHTSFANITDHEVTYYGICKNCS